MESNAENNKHKKHGKNHGSKRWLKTRHQLKRKLARGC